MAEAIVARLNSETAAVMADAEMKATLSEWGIEASPGSPFDFGLHIRDETVSWKERVSRFGVKLE